MGDELLRIKEILNSPSSIGEKLVDLKQYIPDIVELYKNARKKTRKNELDQKVIKPLLDIEILGVTVAEWKKTKYNPDSVIQIKKGNFAIHNRQEGKKFDKKDLWINKINLNLSKINECSSNDKKKKNEDNKYLKQIFTIIIKNATGELEVEKLEELSSILDEILSTISEKDCLNVLEELLNEEYIKLPKLRNTKVCVTKDEIDCLHNKDEAEENSKRNKVILKLASKKRPSVSITKSKSSGSIKGHRKDTSDVPTLGNRDSVARRKSSAKK